MAFNFWFYPPATPSATFANPYRDEYWNSRFRTMLETMELEKRMKIIENLKIGGSGWTDLVELLQAGVSPEILGIDSSIFDDETDEDFTLSFDHADDDEIDEDELMEAVRERTDSSGEEDVARDVVNNKAIAVEEKTKISARSNKLKKKKKKNKVNGATPPSTSKGKSKGKIGSPCPISPHKIDGKQSSGIEYNDCSNRMYYSRFYCLRFTLSKLGITFYELF